MNLKQILKKKSVVIILLLLVIGIPLTVFLALQQQETRSRASGGGVQFELSPKAATTNLGQTFSVDLNVNTQTYSLTGIDTNITINKDIFDFVTFTPASTFDTVVNNTYSPSTGILRITAVNVQKIPLLGTLKVGTLTLRGKTVGTATVIVQSGSQVTALGQTAFLPVTLAINGTYIVAAPATPAPTKGPPDFIGPPEPAITPGPQRGTPIQVTPTPNSQKGPPVLQ